MNTIKPFTLFGFRLRTLIVFAVIGAIGLVVLGADLAFKGVIYDYLWSVTGETAPHKQLLGYTQYLVSLTRDQPETDPYAPIPYTDVSPFGVNTFLEQEVELDKRERQVQMIADAGFKWIRQQFPWEDIEIDAKGDFTDRRHVELYGAISAWDKYDNIVDLAEQYDLDIIARLNGPMPPWSLAEGVTNSMTPPDDIQDYVDYAATVADRYAGRIHYYQVWNEPNLYPEWGDQTVNAEAYTDLLCRTYAALKAVDPDNVVITGALGPTIDLSGRNAYDLLYLQRMYQAGAGDCFDILSVQGYGLWSGPTDHRLRQVTINFQRHLWIRDMMVANGDAHKPIWISEAGWNPVPDDPSIANLDRYGMVTMDQAAEWAPMAYQRALEEWPWIGVINWWYFKPADEREIDQSQYYFRLVEPDFTPTPVYDSLKAYITAAQPKIIGAGRHMIGDTGGDTGHDSARVVVETEGATVHYIFRVKGTRVALCYSAASDPFEIGVSVDGGADRAVMIPGDTVGCVTVADDLGGVLHDEPHTVVLSTYGQRTSVLDSIVVVDDGWRRRLPWILTGMVALLMIGGVVAAGMVRSP
jgi:hypothetical protein